MRFAHRRVRRRDFGALVELFTASGRPAPPADRAALRRFRNIVADLGVDLYVALERERVIGMVHVAYTRHFADGAHAQLVALLVHPERRRLGVGAALLRLATQRAARRHCRALWVAPGADGDGAGEFLRGAGGLPAGACFRIDLPAGTGHIGDLAAE